MITNSQLLLSPVCIHNCLSKFDGKLWRLEKTINIYVDIGDVFVLVIKDGWITDGLSVPKSLQGIVSRFGKLIVAGIIHDALTCTEIIPRKEGDIIFYKVLRQILGCGFAKARAMYYLVRIGGYFVWKSHTKSEIFNARKLITYEQINKEQDG